MQLRDQSRSPVLDEPDTDRLLRALADATRRTLLDRLRDQPGLTLGELAAGFTLTRQALSKHLAALEAAQLVVAMWRGREKLHYLNPLPLQRLPARWVTTTARETGAALTALRQALKPAATPGRDAVAAAFAAEPGAALAGTRIVDAEALAQARHYLAASAEAMQRLIEQLPADAGYARPPGGGFSLAEQVWHLADLDEFGWVPRLERLLAERRPRLPGVDGDRLAVERRYQQRPWRGAARRFIAQRRRALRSLGRFDVEVLRRPAVFAGRATAAGDVLAAMVAHDREHRLEIASLWAREKAR